MNTLRAPELKRSLLHADDLAEPLTLADAVDANAILFTAGERSATPAQIDAFAYFHRKKLRELVEHPGIESDAMLDQLFGTLPQQLKEGALLERLVKEVHSMHDATPRSVAVSKSSKVAVRQTGNQLSMFPSETYAFDAAPSEDLIKKARKFHALDKKCEILGPTLRLRKKLSSSAWRHVLTPLNIADFLVSLSSVLIIDSTVGRFRERSFTRQLMQEYPHVAPARSDPWGKQGNKQPASTVRDYLEAVINQDYNPHNRVVVKE